jgi:uncharacterized protein
MSYQIVVHPLHAIGGLPGWDATVRAAGAPVFYSSQFLSSIALAPLLPTDAAFLIALQSDRGIAGGMPVFRQSCIDPIHHLAPLQSTFPDLSSSVGLLGHCWHCYDSRLVSAGLEVESLQMLVHSLRDLARAEGADYFGLINVAEPRTLKIMASFGMTPRYMTDRYIMDLSRYTSFDDYVVSLQPDPRRELRRQLRRLNESEAEIAIETMPLPDLDEIVLLCRQTAKRYDAEFYYPLEQTKSFLANMGDTMRFVSVRHRGARIGVLVCFFDPPRFHVWAAGMCYGRTAFSPYAVAMMESVRFAITHGFTTLEGGRGNGRIKLKQGFTPLRLHACLERV